MITDSVEKLRVDLAARVVDTLDLPDSVTGDHPRLDKYRLQADPQLLRDIAALLAEQLPPQTEVLAGIELGGIPLAVAIALQTGLPWALIRRPRSDDPASARLAGTPVDGLRTVLVKDMARTGAALGAATTVLRDSGAIVTHAAIGLSWHLELPELLGPLGITPITALTLRDLQPIWRSGDQPR